MREEMSSKRLICLSISLIIVVTISVAVTCIIIFVPSSIFLFESHSTDGSSTQLDFPVPTRYPAILKQDGYDPINIKSISVSNDDPDDHSGSSVVAFYKGSCDTDRTTESNLPDKHRVLQPLGNKKVAFNYNYGYLPLYVAGEESKLTYHISAYNKPLDDTMPCPLELFLFNDESSFMKFMETTFQPEKGYIKRSGCLPVGNSTNELNSTVVFQLSDPSPYYVSVSIAKDVYITATINVHAIEYNITDMELLPCELNYQTNHCIIHVGVSKQIFGINQVSADPVCVWAVTGPPSSSIDMVTRVNITTNANKSFCIVYMSFTIVSGVGFVLCMLMIGVGILVLRKFMIQINRMKREKVSEKQPLIQERNNITYN